MWRSEPKANFTESLSTMSSSYLFQSARLGFRVWNAKDLPAFAEMNAHSEVMQHFPAPLSKSESKKSMEKQISDFNKNGFCYFAVDELASGKLIGMIGMSNKDFPSSFTPAIDIGWRLSNKFWGKGYAAEGAQRCLSFAFEELNLKHIVSIAPLVNENSIRVMQKIGMHKLLEFKHPQLTEHKNLVHCVCYEIKSNTRSLS